MDGWIAPKAPEIRSAQIRRQPGKYNEGDRLLRAPAMNS